MDLKFKKDGHCFKLRSAAIIVEDGFLLVAKNELAEYYYTIGGGIQLSEQAEDAVKREVFEETGVHYDIDHLAVVLENFFIPRSGPLKGINCHEISFYFYMKPRHSRQLNSHSLSGGVPEQMHWLPIKELDQYPLYPLFLKDYFKKDHSGVEHIVLDERTFLMNQ
ncbi:MAG TPA: NUDIX domain-containing protein [Candidatus Pelethenecus faecipullorum]|uniref:NUDIX domain-containing protein n=1 Tax=Candidatus Pelethenecus faecipullorum TaxID=2840900 RepID=A0A9D1GPE1_9MOLU|nr:NUDIX domain-containing protein [Candidatus Pelethenecus faecipullorum]